MGGSTHEGNKFLKLIISNNGRLAGALCRCRMTLLNKIFNLIRRYIAE